MTTQRGNILFLILLAIVLFAALSYAVTNWIRGDGKDGSSEASSADAADIIAYASLIENEVQRKILVNNLNWNQVDFAHEFYTWYGSAALRGNNPNCSNSSCAIFTILGGGVPARDMRSYSTLTKHWSTGHPDMGVLGFRNIVMTNMGTNAGDVVLYLPDLKKEICDGINKNIGLPLADTAGGTTPGWNGTGQRDYWTEGWSINIPSIYLNQRSFCHYNSAYGYVYVHLMIAR